MKWIPGGVTAARGFLASGASGGIKRGRKLDLALVVSDARATTAATFTTNAVTAAPVQISRRRVRRGEARAVLLNSGCANCLTGAAGMRDALRVSRRLAAALRIPREQVLLASTGLIGSRLPVGKIEQALPLLAHRLAKAHHRQAARAILTTDTVPKEAAAAGAIRGRTVHLGGMAKGVGMMAPHMATMLCVLTTDAAFDAAFAAAALREAVEASFNRVTVDGDMSTNDSVFLLANGRSGVTIARGTDEARRFRAMLAGVTQRLAMLLVKDGEGATSVARIEVEGARTAAEARACARRIASSLLVKTMLAGRDPNVGRIAAAAGASGARFDPGRLTVSIDGLGTVVRRGALTAFDAYGARRWLQAHAAACPVIRVGLHAGRAAAWMTTCDLTEEYVRINAHYST